MLSLLKNQLFNILKLMKKLYWRMNGPSVNTAIIIKVAQNGYFKAAGSCPPKNKKAKNCKVIINRYRTSSWPISKIRRLKVAPDELLVTGDVNILLDHLNEERWLRPVEVVHPAPVGDHSEVLENCFQSFSNKIVLNDKWKYFRCPWLPCATATAEMRFKVICSRQRSIYHELFSL